MRRAASLRLGSIRILKPVPDVELKNLNWLGRNIIESACEFEMAAACMIASEAEFLDELLRAGASVRELLHANETICCVVQNLRCLEESIVSKIEKGVDLPPVPNLPKKDGCAFEQTCFDGRLCQCPGRFPYRANQHAFPSCIVCRNPRNPPGS